MADDTWWLDFGDLDPKQQEIIGLDTDDDYLILGPPGSGKTNLVLLWAAQLTRNKRSNVVVLMFNRPLREFVLRGAPNYQLNSEQIKTIHAWGYGLLEEHGIRTDDIPKEPMPSRKELAKRITALMESKPKLKGSLECVLIDEVQDCLPEEIAVFRLIAKNLFATGDVRQQIYDNGDPIAALRASGIAEHRLVYHYRNGQKICKFADAIGSSLGEDPLFPSCNYKEKENVSKAEYFEPANDAEHDALLLDRIRADLKGYPGELVAVAAPLRDDEEAVRVLLSGSDLSKHLLDASGLSKNDAIRRLYVGSLHELKGLEFRAVHLAHMEHVYKLRKVQKKISFMASTRAKTVLSVYAVRSGPGYLRQARDAVTGPASAVDPRSLFPGKSKS
jgi:superfamily I DNA/RNA helicase